MNSKMEDSMNLQEEDEILTSIGTLEKLLMRLYNERSMFFMKKWKRLLPFNEMIVDRWEKAKKLNFGKETSIYDSSIVIGDVKVGKNTWIGPFTILDGSGKLVIGDFCSISAGVQIYTHDSVNWALTGGKAKYKKAPVKIGNSCYLGPLTVVGKGVEIGNHCVIGAHSFVNENIPDYSIAVGIPARIVGKVKIHNNKIKLEYFKK